MEKDYGLDLHCQMIMEEYHQMMGSFEKIQQIVEKVLKDGLKENALLVTAVESRIKTEDSLVGKLELKGRKYKSLQDITDIVGARVIAFFTDDVDKIAAIVENHFDIDWDNSVDKRRMHDLDSFGYMSLHYVCRIPESLYKDPEHPEVNTYRCEIQLRTTLQHMWANMSHNTGYKSGVEVPKEYLRSLNSLAGMMELADNEFSRLRTAINDYRRQVSALMMDRKFDEVSLNEETFRSYLKLNPFDKLNHKIAAVNQAEIHIASLMPYLVVLQDFGFKTLGDVDHLIREYGDAAFQLARYELGVTDLDIVSSNIGIQDLCIVYIVLNGGGEEGLKSMFDTLSGESEYNSIRAQRILETVSHLSFKK